MTTDNNDISSNEQVAQPDPISGVLSETTETAIVTPVTPVTPVVPVTTTSVSTRIPEKQYANGRRAIVEALDNMLAKTHNIHKFIDACQDAFDIDPVGFCRDTVFPLIPKEQLIKVEGTDKAPIRILLDAVDVQPATTATTSTQAETSLPV